MRRRSRVPEGLVWREQASTSVDADVRMRSAYAFGERNVCMATERARILIPIDGCTGLAPLR